MGSSLGLQVHPVRLAAQFRTRFRSGSVALNLAARGDSRTHYAKGIRSRRIAAPIACGRTISGLFHSPHGVLFTFPSRYLFAIGHRVVLSLGGWAPQLRTGFHVSRPTRDTARPDGVDGYGAVTLCRRPFHAVPSSTSVPRRGPTTPGNRFPGLGSRAFARHYSRGLVLISFPQGTEMFHFPWYGVHSLFDSGGNDTAYAVPGCPIRRPADQRELAPPRRFSQLAASFIAARCQGIRRAPVYAWPKALASGASVYIRCNSDSQTIQFSKINPLL